MRLRIMQWFWFTPDRLGDRYGTDRVFRDGKLFDWLWEAYDRVQQAVAKVLCLFAGHERHGDCGCPEHDYCIYCHRSMPGRPLSGASA